mmetsp:Transcript_87208/g.244715  ORF Transcript_87208/g.244715 Transcript_87208/m.244715 type:complete len:357 (+) Transcript_87208:78-1148(+)|eukprot:CAMPEP_0117527678 /NCGR_PEP_ID=MMETSP0784-20121206/36922_1 /TAXON_ID=39447 /ORGANISM="" /LENGTH=356 /DNA_ID=CAMNT_0005323939 /DNA_START=77 /DNA_END=1147 /DNA_ORIENTATION=+
MADVCRFFLKGTCSFGDSCRHKHVRPGAANGYSAPARPGQGQASSAAPEQRLELEEERLDPYDEERCTFQQLRDKYFGVYSEFDIRKYWREEMKPTGTCRPILRPTAVEESRKVCRFFLNGNCTFGEACRNVHVVDVAQLDSDEVGVVHVKSSSSTVPLQQSRTGLEGSSLLKWSQNAAEFNGDDEDELDAAHGSVWPPVDGQTRKTNSAAEGECGICFEAIKSKGEQFGMLEHCDHAFCLSCIRSWRKQKEQQDRVNLRLCPVCRKESFFVTPCDRLILDPAEKAGAIAGYKKKMSTIPCKAFNYGQGKCPLGQSCFYAHLNPDGSRYVAPQPRKMFGAGGAELVGEVRLSDFFA